MAAILYPESPSFWFASISIAVLHLYFSKRSTLKSFSHLSFLPTLYCISVSEKAHLVRIYLKLKALDNEWTQHYEASLCHRKEPKINAVFSFLNLACTKYIKTWFKMPLCPMQLIFITELFLSLTRKLRHSEDDWLARSHTEQLSEVMSVMMCWWYVCAWLLVWREPSVFSCLSHYFPSFDPYTVSTVKHLNSTTI